MCSSSLSPMARRGNIPGLDEGVVARNHGTGCIDDVPEGCTLIPVDHCCRHGVLPCARQSSTPLSQLWSDDVEPEREGVEHSHEVVHRLAVPVKGDLVLVDAVVEFELA